MPNRVIKDVFGELLETGKQVKRQSKKAVSDISKQIGKTLVGRDKDDEEMTRELYSPSEIPSSKSKKKKPEKPENIKRLEKIDKQKSRQMYKEIQEKIKLERRKKKEKYRKYESGKAEFDDEQVKDPESFFEKLKKKKEERKKNKDKLSLSTKKGMGTGEIGRGTSG
ncbi:MAG: hypothetical protein U9Q63_03780 [Patescibacteria group bacterium]|nr:hypothetical protein [Patescibacteria group bacterium]